MNQQGFFKAKVMLSIFMVGWAILSGCTFASTARPEVANHQPTATTSTLPLSTSPLAPAPSASNDATSSSFSNSDGMASIPAAQPILLEHGSREHHIVALTFDADMTPLMKKEFEEGKIKSWYDQKIIELLKKEHVAATLFLTGMWAEMYPEATKSFAQNALFELGNHSYDHAAFAMPCFGLGSAGDKTSEIIKTQDILKKLTGKMPLYFRFPGGCYHQNDLELVAKQGLISAGWDVISGDAYLKDPQKIVAQVLDHVKNGSIIVMHLHGGPHAPATSRALPVIIKGLRAKGFSFVTISELRSCQKSGVCGIKN